MDRLEAAKEIGELEAHVATLEAKLREAERRSASARGNYTSGIVGILLGGIIFPFLPWI